MNTHRLVVFLFVGLAIGSSGQDRVAAQDTSSAAAPAPRSELKWKRIVRLTDGRTLISDGAIALDVEWAKPALPSDQKLPEASAKIIESYLTADLPNDFALSQLTRRGDQYAASNNVTLNPVYVDYLRRILPESRVRLHTKGDADPVVIFLDGKAIGLLMPMKPTNPPSQSH